MKKIMRAGIMAGTIAVASVASAPASAVLVYHLGAMNWAFHTWSNFAHSLSNWLITNHMPTFFPVLQNRADQFPILVPPGYGHGSTYPPGINDYVIIGPTSYD